MPIFIAPRSSDPARQERPGAADRERQAAPERLGDLAADEQSEVARPALDCAHELRARDLGRRLAAHRGALLMELAVVLGERLELARPVCRDVDDERRY